ncbi:MAG: hypoxanthine phosphoribosyltransferase [Actinomycetaceae bacterium]|nr:hypoxanthine phosphoribosyltransferase [Arcanobacterium sp.]MDD7504932.1 hypoxanthine phosphoribosyltransferase [Actinomycetaceae bacterium]MDY6143278.1 hypoxanthine phosphoribosyltransferase [Arcanobacterium sp.]
MNREDAGSDILDVLISEEQINERLEELGEEISRDYAGEEILLVGVLRGAIMVMADLSRKIHRPVQMDWMAVSSYGAGTKSSGVVRILKDLNEDIKDRHVLIVEDVLDSGLTLSWLKANLESRRPKSIKVATFLRKPAAEKVHIDPDYVGFDIPDAFVVGYGLDYAENYRHLPFIATLAPQVYGEK